MINNYHEEITIEQIAEQVNLNVSYFHKIFKQNTGQTPMDYLNIIRINKAKVLLENSDIPVIEICSSAGFNSRQYFTYSFKRKTGQTPVEYRRSMAAKKQPSMANSSCYDLLIKA